MSVEFIDAGSVNSMNRPTAVTTNTANTTHAYEKSFFVAKLIRRFMIIPSFMPERLCYLASDEVAIESYVAKLSLIEHNQFVALVRTP